MILRSRLSTNTLTLLLSSVGGALLSFVLVVLIGRALGEDGLGRYAAALAWVLPLTLLAEFGLGTLITREVAQTPEQAGTYLHRTLRPRLLLGGGVMLALLLGAPLLSRDAMIVQGIQISAPLVLIAPSFGACTAVFRARRVMWPVAALNLGMLTVQVTLTVAVLHLGRGVLAALLVNTMTSAGQWAAAWLIYRRWFRTPATPGQLPVGLSLLRRSWPFAVAGVLAAAQMRLGFIVVEVFAGVGEVGYYAAASRFVEALRLLPNAFFGALFPTLAVLAADRARLNRMFRWVLAGLGGFGLLAALGLCVIAGPVIEVAYGAAFVPAAGVLPVLGWALLLSLIRAGQTLYHYALGREGRVNRVIGAGLVVQALLSAGLVPAWGAVGAAWALVGAEIVQVAMLTYGSGADR